MGYQHIVFDVDGTLLDTETANLRSLQDTLLEITGQAPPLEALQFTMGIPGADALVALKLPDPDGSILKLWEGKLAGYHDLVRLFPGIPELIRELHRRGLGLGVVTSRTRQELDADFDRLDFAPLFRLTVCTEETPLHKPHADPLLYYMAKTGTSADAVLYIGDSPYDMQCAANAGVGFALAGWGAAEVLPAPHVLQRPEELLELLD